MEKRDVRSCDYPATSSRAFALAALLAGLYHTGQIAHMRKTKNAPESLNVPVDPDFNELILKSWDMVHNSL